MIDSLQRTAEHKVATPVNWRQGEEVIIAGELTSRQAHSHLLAVVAIGRYCDNATIASAVSPD